MEHHSSVSVDEQFKRSPRLVKNLLIIMVAGAILFIGGTIIHANFGGDHGGGHGSHANKEKEHGGNSKIKEKQLMAEAKGINAENGHEKNKTGSKAGSSHGDKPEHRSQDSHEDHGSKNSENKHEEGGHAGNDHNEHAEHGGHHGGFDWKDRFFANLWLENMFFTGIAVIGLFFVLVQYVSWAGWSASLKRVPESFGAFLPVAFVTVILTFAFGAENIFMWVDPPPGDELIEHKSGYLNVPFFVIRLVIYFAVWYLVWWYMRKYSVKEDIEGTDKYHLKTSNLAGGFVVIFAITSSTSAWDWIMSIDTHWFSTMFGWYIFASWWITGLATITLVTIYLKQAGYLKAVNENHIHNLGLFVFAFSVFWTYIWFEQFLLYFYGNLSEETIYFINRLQGYDHTYTLMFYALPVLNFVFPFIALMTRESKRKIQILKIVSFGVLIGHWLDFFVMIMPGTTGKYGSIGIMEIGGLLFFAALFLLVVTKALSNQKLIPVNHPMLKESIHHEY